MITIVDYGLGNINAIINTCKAADVKTRLAKSALDLESAQLILLPGVGHFDQAMTLLNESGMRNTLDDMVLNKSIPILGICVGMQIMANGSEEGSEMGLGYIDAQVKKFDISKIEHQTKIPHMGWNNIEQIRQCEIFNNIEKDASFYFLHSYYVKCANMDHDLSFTDYAGTFTSAIKRENIYGVQFHPEKSHQNGEILLQNFSKM